MLALVGVPGIYFHSLFGSRGWREGVAQTGQKRTINREKLELAALERELADVTSRRHRVFARLAGLLKARAEHAAFDPFGEMRVPDVDPAVLAVVRGDRVLCLHNVSAESRAVEWSCTGLPEGGRWADLLTGRPVEVSPRLGLLAYQTRWLARE